MIDGYLNNKSYGWICPNCGKVNAPWMPSCDCRVSSTITNNSTASDWTTSHATTSSGMDKQASGDRFDIHYRYEEA